MFNVDKCINIPESLAKEKKKNGTYRSGDVLKQLKIDFFDKCYLCETKLSENEITIDHFKPYLNSDLHKKFDWYNLFLCCKNCNSTKGSDYNNLQKNKDILDCTNKDHKVYDWLLYSYGVNKFNKLKGLTVEIDVAIDESKDNKSHIKLIEHTKNLLNTIYNSKEIKDKKLSRNVEIKDSLVKELGRFRDILRQLDEDAFANNEIYNQIKEAISRKSPFSAFKRQIIKNKPEYYELKKYFD